MKKGVERVVLIAMIILFASCQGGGKKNTTKTANIVVPGTGTGKGKGGVNGGGNGASGGTIPLPPNLPPGAGPPFVVNSCPANCLTCKNATYCIECDAGYHLVGDGSCALNGNPPCAAGTYQTLSGTCVSCPARCLQCVINSCLSCVIGCVLVGGNCDTCM